MTANWHYADGASTRGPMTLAELTSALSFVSSPHDALVWRPGFEGWRRAGDVKELAETFFRPPPLPPSPPSPPTAPPPPVVDRTARPQVDDAHPFGPSVANANLTRDPKLEGIGGWLVLVALGQVLGPLRFLASMGEYYSTLDRNLMQRFPISFAGEIALNVVLGILFFYTAVLFFRKSKRFPMFFFYEIVAAVISLPLNAAWVALTMSAASDQSAGAIFQAAFEPREVGQTIAIAITGCIWTLYLFKSKRVANTFIH